MPGFVRRSLGGAKAIVLLGLCLLAIIVSIGAAGTGAPSSTPAPGTRVEVPRAKLSIALPSEVSEVPVGGAIDSLVHTYQGPGLKMLMDYGAYSDPLKDIPAEASELQIQQEVIGGKPARLVTYRVASGTGGQGSEFPYFAGVHFSDLGRGPMHKLTLTANAESPEAQASAIQIMKSILFSE